MTTPLIPATLCFPQFDREEEAVKTDIIRYAITLGYQSCLTPEQWGKPQPAEWEQIPSGHPAYEKYRGDVPEGEGLDWGGLFRWEFEGAKDFIDQRLPPRKCLIHFEDCGWFAGDEEGYFGPADVYT